VHADKLDAGLEVTRVFVDYGKWLADLPASFRHVALKDVESESALLGYRVAFVLSRRKESGICMYFQRGCLRHVRDACFRRISAAASVDEGLLPGSDLVS